MTLLERMQSLPRPTRRDTALIRFLNDHEQQLPLLTAAAIGSNTGVSAATVVRFFVKLGYEGLAQAQAESRRALLQNNSPLQRIKTMAHVHAGEGAGASLLRQAERLHALAERVDEAQLSKLADLLMKPGGRVWIAGAKNSYSVAHQLMVQLNECRSGVNLLPESPATQASQLVDLGRTDLLVAFSFARYARQTTLLAQRFVQAKAPIVLVTDSRNSPLWPLAQHQLQVTGRDESPFMVYVEACALIHALVMLLSQRHAKAVQARLKLTEASWSAFELFEKM